MEGPASNQVFKIPRLWLQEKVRHRTFQTKWLEVTIPNHWWLHNCKSKPLFRAMEGPAANQALFDLAFMGMFMDEHFLIKKSRPVSRVLSWATIHLGNMSPCHSCSLPESSASRTIGFLFGLAPSGVYHAMECCHPCGGLLPHHFTLTSMPIKTSEAVYFLLHFP